MADPTANPSPASSTGDPSIDDQEAAKPRILEAVWTKTELDVLDYVVSKRSKAYVLNWIAGLSAVLAVGVFFGWNGINTVQDSLKQRSKELDDRAKELEAKAKELDKTVDAKAAEINTRFEATTKNQQAAINAFREQQDRVVEAFRKDERETRRSVESSNAALLTTSQALVQSQQELRNAVEATQKNVQTTRGDTKRATEARARIERYAQETQTRTQKQIDDTLARVASLEKIIQAKKAEVEAIALALKGAPVDSGGPVLSRRRPAAGGDSIGVETSTEGSAPLTLGCLVHDAQGARYVLTVPRTPKPSGVVFQPSAIDGGRVTSDTIATVARFILPQSGRPNNNIGLVAKVNDPSLVSAEIRGIGKLKGVADAKLGGTVRKAGRTTGVTTGRVTTIGLSTRVLDPEGEILFNDMISVEALDGTAMAKGGDSGAILVDQDNNAVGILYAGSDRASLFLPIRPVLRALGVELVTE